MTACTIHCIPIISVGYKHCILIKAPGALQSRSPKNYVIETKFGQIREILVKSVMGHLLDRELFIRINMVHIFFFKIKIYSFLFFIILVSFSE